MAWLLDIPLPIRLAVVFVVAAGVASLLNAAIYLFGYRGRRVSPWQRAPEGVAPRVWADRTPIIGWLRLRRDAAVLGRGFWVRPMAIELLFAAGMATLYWWEVDQHALVDGLIPVVTPLDWRPLAGVLHAQFLAHALLCAFMTAATFIDFDEQIIPDEVTWPGTILGLFLVAAAPMAALPHVAASTAAPRLGAPLVTPGGAPVVDVTGVPFYVMPVSPFTPRDWPPALVGLRNHESLLVGLGCLWLWVFAVADRTWPKRLAYSNRTPAKVAVWGARLARSMRSTPLREVAIAGTLLVAMAWFGGGGAWLGLLAGLVGMVLGGAVAWAVRIIGSAAMGREAMGFGDVTLMMMAGVYLGWQAMLIVFFLAPFAGLLIGVAKVLLRRGDDIPYGPFLCLAAVALIVWWAPIWDRAQGVFAMGWFVPIALVGGLVMLGVLLWLIQLAKRPFLRRGDN